MPDTKQRLLIIGIDGGTYTLLDPMAERGLIPNIAALARSGFRATLRSTIPPNSAAAWATFMTGKNPGRHGVLRFQATRPTSSLGREFRPGAYTFVNAASIPGRRIWDIAGQAGKRTAVINLPMTYPPRPLNGIMITGLLTPPEAEDFTYPPELASTLRGYRIEQPLATMGFGKAADRELVRVSQEILEQQGETALRFLAGEDWDLFLVVFTGTDRLQHRLWNYLDPAADGEKPDDFEFFRSGLDKYYATLDSIVGRLVEAAGAQADCIILSDHGFGPAPRLAVYRRALARRLGLEAGEGVGGFHALRAWLERHGVLDGDRLRRLLAGTPFRRLLSRISRVAKVKEQEAWRSSEAYLVVLHKYIGGVGINIAPESPRYEPFRAALMEKLAEVRDPNDGRRIITDIWRREEIYRGARLKICPDIVFRLDERYGLAHGEAPGGRLVCPKTFRSKGMHRDEGILILAGPDIARGKAERMIPVQDVTATALYLLDLPIPRDMDGQVVIEAVSPAYRESHPVRFEKPAEEFESPSLPEAAWRSADDEDAIAERLRELGYLD